MQGDCLSALLFIYYLAECLKGEEEKFEGKDMLLIKPKYADDITYVTKNKDTSERIKNIIPKILETHNLKINETKTEEFAIPKPPPPPPPAPAFETLLKHKNDKNLWSDLDWLINYKPIIKDTTPNWKLCKILGSLLDSDKDFERRKALTLDAMKKYEHIFKSKHVGNKMKLRTFNMYIASVFLYNTEIWGINKVLADKINSFHRRIIRYAINIKWPKRISNEKLREKTNYETWSKTIKRRRLNLLGHIMRLDILTPVRIALKEALTPVQNKRGRPKNTWLKTVINDLTEGGIVIRLNKPEEILETLINITKDRKLWKRKIGTLMQ